MKRVIFMGSKPIGYYCLHYLIEQQQNIGFEVLGVLSNDNRAFGDNLSISGLTAQHNIPFIEKLDDILELPNIDIIISVQYHQILKPKHIQVAKEIAINLHMAPLPEFRGCNQFSFAILNEAKEFGTTIHQIDNGVDSGPIISEERFAIPEGIYVDELYDITFSASISLFQKTIPKIISKTYSLTPQSALLGERLTAIHYRKEINQIKKVNLDEETIRKVRATAMPGFEPPYALDGSLKIYLIPEHIYKKIKS